MDKQKEQYIRMTETPVEKLLVKLSIPTIITMMVTNLYNLADTAFVGTLGNSASGAVGVVFGFMAMLQAIGFMFGQGGGSLASRQMGAKQKHQADVTASTAFFSSFFMGIAFSIICLIVLEPLCRFLGSTDTILPYAKTYVLCIIAAAPFMISSFTLNNLLRYEGKAVLGMAGMMVGAFLNVGIDALLIFVFKIGILGAGIATAFSQFVGFLVLLSMFLRGKTTMKLNIRLLREGLKELPEIFGTGFPSLLRQGLQSLNTVMLNFCAKPFGDEAIAAMSISMRVSFFVFAVALGICQGFQPISSFNYGAGKYSRVRKAYKVTTLYAEILIFVITLLVIPNAAKIVYLFRADMTVVEIGTRALILQCIAQLFQPVATATEMMYQSTGHKLGASIMSGCKSGFIFIPMLLILSKLRGIAGIQEAQPVAFMIGLFVSIGFAIRFFKKMPKEDFVVGDQ